MKRFLYPLSMALALFGVPIGIAWAAEKGLGPLPEVWGGDSIGVLGGVSELSEPELELFVLKYGTFVVPSHFPLQRTPASLTSRFELRWSGFHIDPGWRESRQEPGNVDCLQNLELQKIQRGFDAEVKKKRARWKVAGEFFQDFGEFSEGNPVTDLVRCGGQIEMMNVSYEIQVIEGWNEELLALYFKGFPGHGDLDLVVKLYGAEFLCPWDDGSGFHRRSLPNGWLIRKPSSGYPLAQIRLTGNNRFFAAMIKHPWRGWIVSWYLFPSGKVGSISTLEDLKSLVFPSPRSGERHSSSARAGAASESASSSRGGEQHPSSTESRSASGAEITPVGLRVAKIDGSALEGKGLRRISYVSSFPFPLLSFPFCPPFI